MRVNLTVNEIQTLIEAVEFMNDDMHEFDGPDAELTALQEKLGRILQDAGLDRYDE